MESYRTLDVKLGSADDLKVVNRFTKMEVYAIVKVSGDKDHKQKFKSHADPEGGANPTWNFPVKFTVDDSLLHQDRLKLVFKLVSQRALGDKDVGKVKIPLKELQESAGDNNSALYVSYHVKKPSGKPRGMLTFSYKFGEKVDMPKPEENAKEADYYGYAPPPGTSAAPYPVPPHEYGYPPPGYAPYPGHGYPAHPPPHGYGYPPPPQGYGYPPPHAAYGGYPSVEQPHKGNKNKSGPGSGSGSGMGFGAGLLGGAIGGLLIGDMIADAEHDDGGCDYGF